MASSKTIRAHVEGSLTRLDVELPLLDAAVALGLGADPDLAELRAKSSPLTAWFGARLEISKGSRRCAYREGSASVRAKSKPSVLVLSLAYVCQGSAGRVLLRDRSLSGHEDHETLVIMGGQLSDTLRDEEAQAILAAGDAWSTARGFLWQGIRHLATGYDHLLFLLSLILALGTRDACEGVRQVGWVVTAFTLGHSVTLVLGTLGWLVLPPSPVEATIALSIVAVALLNLLRPTAHLLRPRLAFVFGWVHGLGFSSFLSQLELPWTHELLGLLAFNVGIELGQLLFVLVLAVPLYHLGRHRWYRPVVLMGGSTVIALVASKWFAERTGLL